MPTDFIQERQEAHAFLDRLAPEQLRAVHNLLEDMLDPLDRKLALAPIDDEPETEEERRDDMEAIESLDRKGGMPMEVVLAELGLTVTISGGLRNRTRPKSNKDDGE